MTSLIWNIERYLEEESASKHKEGPQGPPTKWPFFTISQGKITKKVGHFTEGKHHSYEAGIGFKMLIYHLSLFPEIFSLTQDIHHGIFSIKWREISK